MIEVFILYEPSTKMFYKGKSAWTNDLNLAKRYVKSSHAKSAARYVCFNNQNNRSFQIIKFEATCTSKEDFSW